jgi:hypothetical protein
VVRADTLDQFPEHRRVLDAVVAACRADPRVTGVLLGGSNVAGGMDGYSDVDLDVVVADAVFGERDRVVAAAGRPLLRFLSDVPGLEHLYVVLYDSPAGPVKLDVEYHRAGAVGPSEWLTRCRPLLDRTGALATARVASAGLPPPAPLVETLRDLDQRHHAPDWRTARATPARLEHPFRVGQRYANRNGEYDVLRLEGEQMTIRYVGDGREQSVSVPLQARIWDNLRLGLGGGPTATPYLPGTARTSAEEGPVVKTIPWDAYADHAIRVALPLRAALQQEFPAAYRIERGSDSIVGSGGTIVKVLPFDGSVGAVAHLGSGALLGFRAGPYTRCLEAGLVPEPVLAERTPYRFGGGVYRSFYVLPVHTEAESRAKLPHVVALVRRLLASR